jgi:alanine racemase
LPEGRAEPTSPDAARIEVDLGALERNFRRLASTVAPARLLPVVKADAYGHGAAQVAATLAPLGAAGFLVARPEEGVALRAAGIGAPILVGSPSAGASLPWLARYDLTPVVSDLERLAELEAFAASQGWRAGVHLKVDTGMHRLGVPIAAVPAAIECLRRSRSLRWEGLLSHLAEAEDPASPRNEEQARTFAAVVDLLTPEERRRIAVHLANSAGALRFPVLRHDWIRPGLALYGGEPAESGLGLEGVLALRAPLLQIREVAPGGRVGYGGRWRAERASRVGIVGVGYADGYPGGGPAGLEALVGGRRVPLAGAVSMDLLSIDVTGCDVCSGDEVTLLGVQADEEIRITELARRSGVLAYEILCRLRLRLPRFWLAGRRVSAPALEGSV